MAFFCIAGALLCLPPHNTSYAYNYAAYAVPIQQSAPVLVAPPYTIDRFGVRRYG